MPVIGVSSSAIARILSAEIAGLMSPVPRHIDVGLVVVVVAGGGGGVTVVTACTQTQLLPFKSPHQLWKLLSSWISCEFPGANV